MSESCSLTKTVCLSEFTQRCLTGTLWDDLPSESTLGGILSNAKHAWYSDGPRFQVVELATGRAVAGWCFGAVVRDASTRVVAVVEDPTSSDELPLLVIGLECAAAGGIVCLFDVLPSKVLRAIQLEEKVSSLHVIDGGSNSLPISRLFQCFDGVVGVGCVGGDVVLLDLCRHAIEEEERDEMEACEVLLLTADALNNFEHHKKKSQPGVHLGIYLNESNNQIPTYKNSPNISVTSLHYCPQIGSLLVGYSFGAWQIWELSGMSLVYTSPVYDKHIPIQHFAIQEPSDDPKPVCYVWAVYSYKEMHRTCPLAVMYSLNYSSKEFHEGYGTLYQELESCSVRYQTELSGSARRPRDVANCVRLTAYRKSKPAATPAPAHESHHEDALSVCYFAWNADGGGGAHLGLFDLDQWYKAQMPAGDDDSAAESYLAVVRLGDLLDEDAFAMDVMVDERSFAQFLGVQRPEEHYFPSALGFEVRCIERKSIHFIRHEGKQRTLLNNLGKAESLIFLKPVDTCQTALQLGLTPIFFDSSLNTIYGQREFLLSLALEQKMASWLCSLASVWSNGRFKSTDCTLEFFLEWAWNRAAVLKTNSDALVTPLLDYSESVPDTNSQRIINVCIGQLSRLLMIFDFVLNKLHEFVLHKKLLEQRYTSLKMIVAHLQVIQWLINSNLLPEGKTSFFYPIDSLLPYYEKRRSDVQDAYYRRFTSNDPVLFVDNLLQHEFYNRTLQNYWIEDEGNGLYPPPSMQSLLRTYLTEEVTLIAKHMLVIYAFLDLAQSMTVDREQNNFPITQLIKFPVIFKIDPCVAKLTQAFWCLDHEDFGVALERLMDPLIRNGDLKTWHHRMVLNSLLVQKQHNSALIYYQFRKPHLNEDEDVLKVLTLFIENCLINEALDFQRKYVTTKNHVRLLTHLCKECSLTKQLPNLLQYDLTDPEERVIMKHLRDVAHPSREHLETIFYLHRFRYADVLRMPDGRGRSRGLEGRKTRSVRDSVATVLGECGPGVATEALRSSRNPRLPTAAPSLRPLSATIYGGSESGAGSNLIRVAMEAAKGTWAESRETEGREKAAFVRSPTGSVSNPRKRPPLISPKIIKVGEDDDNDGDAEVSPSSKKGKFSPRHSVGTPVKKSADDSGFDAPLSKVAKLETPVIKRKSVRSSAGQETRADETATRTPQSILKVRSSVASGTRVQDEQDTKSFGSPSTSGLLLTPRRSLSRLSVHFDRNTTILSSADTSKETTGSSEYTEVSEGLEDVSSRSKEASDEKNYSPEETCLDQEPESEPKLEESSAIRDTSLQIKGRSSYKERRRSLTPEKQLPTRKSKSRKSLSRMVLENNAMATLSSGQRRRSLSGVLKGRLGTKEITDNKRRSSDVSQSISIQSDDFMKDAVTSSPNATVTTEHQQSNSTINVTSSFEEWSSFDFTFSSETEVKKESKSEEKIPDIINLESSPLKENTDVVEVSSERVEKLSYVSLSSFSDFSSFNFTLSTTREEETSKGNSQTDEILRKSRPRDQSILPKEDANDTEVEPEPSVTTAPIVSETSPVREVQEKEIKTREFEVNREEVSLQIVSEQTDDKKQDDDCVEKSKESNNDYFSAESSNTNLVVNDPIEISVHNQSENTEALNQDVIQISNTTIEKSQPIDVETDAVNDNVIHLPDITLEEYHRQNSEDVEDTSDVLVEKNLDKKPEIASEPNTSEIESTATKESTPKDIFQSPDVLDQAFVHSSSSVIEILDSSDENNQLDNGFILSENIKLSEHDDDSSTSENDSSTDSSESNSSAKSSEEDIAEEINPNDKEKEENMEIDDVVEEPFELKLDESSNGDELNMAFFDETKIAEPVKISSKKKSLSPIPFEFHVKQKDDKKVEENVKISCKERSLSPIPFELNVKQKDDKKGEENRKISCKKGASPIPCELNVKQKDGKEGEENVKISSRERSLSPIPFELNVKQKDDKKGEENVKISYKKDASPIPFELNVKQKDGKEVEKNVKIASTKDSLSPIPFESNVKQKDDKKVEENVKISCKKDSLSPIPFELNVKQKDGKEVEKNVKIASTKDSLSPIPFESNVKQKDNKKVEENVKISCKEGSLSPISFELNVKEKDDKAVEKNVNISCKKDSLSPIPFELNVKQKYDKKVEENVKISSTKDLLSSIPFESNVKQKYDKKVEENVKISSTKDSLSPIPFELNIKQKDDNKVEENVKISSTKDSLSPIPFELNIKQKDDKKVEENVKISSKKKSLSPIPFELNVKQKDNKKIEESAKPSSEKKSSVPISTEPQPTRRSTRRLSQTEHHNPEEEKPQPLDVPARRTRSKSNNATSETVEKPTPETPRKRIQRSASLTEAETKAKQPSGRKTRASSVTPLSPVSESPIKVSRAPATRNRKNVREKASEPGPSETKGGEDGDGIVRRSLRTKSVSTESLDGGTTSRKRTRDASGTARDSGTSGDVVGLRMSTRSRSKTPELATKKLQKEVLENIPEEQEVLTEEPKPKRGRPKKKP